MHQNDRVAIVRKTFEEFAVGSVDFLMSVIADDIVVTLQPGHPLGREFRGQAGMEEYFTRTAELVEVSDFECTDILASDDKVVAVGHETLRAVRSGVEQPHTEWAAVFSFQGRRIAQVLLIEDTALLSRAAQTT